MECHCGGTRHNHYMVAREGDDMSLGFRFCISKRHDEYGELAKWFEFSTGGNSIARGFFYWDVPPKILAVVIPKHSSVSLGHHWHESDCVQVIKVYNHISDLPDWKDEQFCREAVSANAKAYPLVPNKTDAVKMEALVFHPKLFLEINPQTETLCKQAISKNPRVLEYIQNQTDVLCRMAIHLNYQALQYVRNQTEALCVEAIQQEGRALEYVRDKTWALCQIAVTKNSRALKFVPESMRTDDMCMDALKNARVNKGVFWKNNIKNPSHDLCMRAIREYPFLLSDIENPTNEMIRLAISGGNSWAIGKLSQDDSKSDADMMTAVRSNGHVISSIKQKTQALCDAAIQTTPEAIQHIPAEFQTRELCLTAVSKYGMLLEHVLNQTPEICIAAIRQNPQALFFVRQQTPEICKAAIQTDCRMFEHVKTKTPELFAVYKAERDKQHEDDDSISNSD